VSLVKVTVTKNRNVYLLNNLSLLWPIVTKLGACITYIKSLLGITTQVTMIEVKVTKLLKFSFAEKLDLVVTY
jgi:hypothetical protein